jgi:hypothetical protein
MERIKDMEQRNLGNEIEKVYAFLDEVSKDSEWIKPRVDECGLIHFPRNIINVTDVDANNVSKKFLERNSGAKIPTEGIDQNKEAVLECMDERALFLVVPGDNKYRVIPLESTGRAFHHILYRAGFFCRMANAEVKTSAVTPIPPEKRAEIVNYLMQLNHIPMTVLVRWGKVDAALSKDYIILDMKELLHTCVSALEERYESVTLSSSSWDHEFFDARFDVKDELFAEEVKDTLRKLGINANDVNVKFIFYTSDVGMASATGRVYLTVDGQDVYLPSGDVQNTDVRHYGATSVTLFEEGLKKYLENAGQVDIEKVERLGNIQVPDITEAMKDCQEKFKAVLPKELTEAVVSEYVLKNGNTGTAIDCYMCANAVVCRSIAQKGGHTRDAVNAMNALAKIANYLIG